MKLPSLEPESSASANSAIPANMDFSSAFSSKLVVVLTEAEQVC